MNPDHLNLILAQVETNAASGAPAAAQRPAIFQFFPIILFAVVMYLVLIRPQQKKAKEHAALLKTIKSGDKVVTNAGIVGVVIHVKETTVSLRSAEAKFEVLKSAITEITERGGASETAAS